MWNYEILRKNPNSFWRNRSTTSQIQTVRQIIEEVRSKNFKEHLFLDFFIIRLHTQTKDEANTPCECFPKKTVAAIIMLYKGTKVMVGSAERDTNFFDIVTRVLQGDTLAQRFFILCLHNSFEKMVSNLKKQEGEYISQKLWLIPTM